MKHNIKSYFAASAFLLLAAGCTSDDDFGRIPEGGIPLNIGRVAVAGVETAGGNTRAAITEDASGFTGIRKTTFVNDDALSLVLSDDGGTTTTTVTATLTDGQWVLNPAKNFVIPGTTTIKATYSPTATSGMKADNLEATTYTLDGQKVAFAMKHVNALLDITYTASVALESMTVTANNGTADETLSTALEEEADGTKHFRAIASPGTVKSLTAVINGKNYIATLATPLAVEANKRYPIALTFKENALTATVGSAELNWGIGGTGELYPFPAGYDYYIGTPEDLAQFAYDVNKNLNNARTAKVLQTADIDLAQLKTAADANTANPGKSYTYTATADNWVPIAFYYYGEPNGVYFSGTYNGNGHTVSNMKITSASEYMAAFFGCLSNATLTGIHLRGVSISVNNANACAALCCYVEGSGKISLCSATGDISAEKGADYSTIDCGGLISQMMHASDVTRCSSGVNIKVKSVSFGKVGGFIGRTSSGGIIAGCSYNGNIDCSGSDVNAGGFIGQVGNNGYIFGCSAKGTLVKGTQSIYAFSAVSMGSSHTITSCYSTMTGGDGFGVNDADITYTDCAYTGTQSTVITGDVTEENIYATITAGSASSPAAIKTLHWSAADKYTTTEVSDTWNASVVWKDNGIVAPTIDMTYEGGTPMYNGKESNLLAIPGQTAYWVAPENAMTGVHWDVIDFNTVCPEGWHVPTIDEIKAMTGLTDVDVPLYKDPTAIIAAFPYAGYWTASLNASGTPLILSVNSYADGSSEVIIYSYDKGYSFNVRCVRK